MLLSLKRYIGRNTVVEWALFHLQMQIQSRRDLLFNISSFSKTNMRKDFERLKNLLSVPPKQRSQQILRQIQFCLKKNRAFQSLRDKTQLELCQHIVYQMYETKTLVIKQGHVPCECYIVLSGHLNAVTGVADAKTNATSNTLYEVEEGDFVGDIGLITNQRLISFICKTDVELLVIEKEVFNEILAAKVREQHSSLCSFLRNMPLFSSWPPEKMDLLVHCSLQRNYRAGTTVVLDSTNSSLLVLIKSGRCLIVVELTQNRPSADSGASRNYSSLVERFPTIPFLLEKSDSLYSTFQKPLLPRASYSASIRTAPNQIHVRPRPQTVGPSALLRNRKEPCDLGLKGKRHSEDKRSFQPQATELSYKTHTRTSFITVGTLEKGGIFGLTETMIKSSDLRFSLGLTETMMKSSDLRFSLISEGAECIFIPKKLFHAEAPTKSRHVAQELINSFPTENKIRSYYASHRTWTAYKNKIIGQQLTRTVKH
ncbi:uncharacterized protein LOC134615461 [Pelobates fuscus]|uniref:uncharacterized protein LOC134615461 n=1 Tax=Pelobates fuscus TaxID=191477 RepID=UPI002FE4D6D9